MEKKYTLPREFAEKWVKALRSKKYKQDTDHNQYRYNDCYCAWGVYGVANKFKFITDSTCVKGKVELYNSVEYELFKFIYRLNDREKLTFPQIADEIETNVEFI